MTDLAAGSTESAPCEHCGLPVPTRRRRSEPPWYCCLGCRIARQIALPALASDADESEASTRFLRLGTGIFLALNVMIASWLSYSREILGIAVDPQGSEGQFLQLAAYGALFLCTLVIAILGAPLALDSLRALFGSGRIDAQLLIVIGVFSAYILSVVHTVRGSGPLYFDTAAVVLVVVTLGAHLESRAKQRSSAAASRRLVELPRRLRVERDGQEIVVSADEAALGDRVEVLPGATVPVDGTVLEGSSRVDESSFTGESRPRLVDAGASLLAGSHNHEGRLLVETTAEPDETVLALIESSLASARSARPPIQRLADRIAAVFVPGVILLAAALFGWHLLLGDAETGLMRSLGVLLISCPCALGLAAPLATWHGLRRAAERGVVIDSPATLERIAALESLYFDKTGTLTRPEPVLDGVAAAEGVDPSWVLGAAVSLEAASSHPIAVELVRRSSELDLEPRPVTDALTVPGRGVEATYQGRRLRFGSLRWLRESGLETDLGPSGSYANAIQALYLMDESRVLGCLSLAEHLRTDAQLAVSELKRLEMEPVILTGDAQAAADRVAQALGVSALGDLLPDDKVKEIARARVAGPVAMIGDGLNDVPVLSAADVGIAVGSASDLAQRSGNVRLTSDRLSTVPKLISLSRSVRQCIRLNLGLAFGFNSIGILLAASGLLTPVFAAVAMALSSLAVLKISSRAGRLDDDRGPEASMPAAATPLEAHG